MHKIAGRVASVSSIGACSFTYRARRARWYLTGIDTLGDLLRLLRIAEGPGLFLRPRRPGRFGPDSRTPRTGR